MAAETQQNSYGSRSTISAAETNQLLTGRGIVKRLIVSAVGTGATLDLYDHANANTNLIHSWVSADGKASLDLEMPVGSGIRVVSGGTFGRATIVWK